MDKSITYGEVILVHDVRYQANRGDCDMTAPVKFALEVAIKVEPDVITTLGNLQSTTIS
jgi:hypothetical protein